MALQFTLAYGIQFHSQISRSNITKRIELSSSISNLRKPVFNATCAVSVFYAN
ncbi:hypothetical protein T03_3889 [Trichinella britovi]|uniref:Uncharacterized protein n=1 Tax=Trichinella britovi TaxID=45882 RepID=A0A0V1AQJ5_TRIBR|nr:hypothetical protein T03_3889 [Trichinella britovi]